MSYTSIEAAHYLKMSPGTFRNICSEGRGPTPVGTRGRALLYSRHDLDLFTEKTKIAKRLRSVRWRYQPFDTLKNVVECLDRCQESSP